MKKKAIQRQKNHEEKNNRSMYQQDFKVQPLSSLSSPDKGKDRHLKMP